VVSLSGDSRRRQLRMRTIRNTGRSCLTSRMSLMAAIAMNSCNVRCENDTVRAEWHAEKDELVCLPGLHTTQRIAENEFDGLGHP
jgi:hypothetical protein